MGAVVYWCCVCGVGGEYSETGAVEEGQMNITLEYDDEDRYEAERALKVDSYAAVLWDLDQWLREFMRHNDREWPDVPRVLTKLATLIDANGLEFAESAVDSGSR